MAILTIEDLKAYGVTLSNKDTLQAMLSTAEEVCLAYIGYEERTVEDYYDGGVESVVLRHRPVSSVVSVEVAGTPIAYSFDTWAKCIYFDEIPPTGRRNVKVKYLVGWTRETAPSSIKTAIALTVMHLNKLNTSKLVGVTSRTTDGGTEAIEQSIPTMAAKGLLEGLKGPGALV